MGGQPKDLVTDPSPGLARCRSSSRAPKAFSQSCRRNTKTQKHASIHTSMTRSLRTPGYLPALGLLTPSSENAARYEHPLDRSSTEVASDLVVARIMEEKLKDCFEMVVGNFKVSVVAIRTVRALAAKAYHFAPCGLRMASVFGRAMGRVGKTLG